LPTSTTASDYVTFSYPHLMGSCKHMSTGGRYPEGDAPYNGVCAFVPSINRYYGCPQGRSYCETTGNTWAASTNGKIKSNKLCEMGNKRWSCHETEHCPNGASQLGMCLAPFPSPVEDVEVNETIEVLKLASLDAISRDRQTLFEPGKWCAGATHLMARMAAVLAVMAGLMLFVRRRRENARSSLMTGDIAQWSHEQFPGRSKS